LIRLEIIADHRATSDDVANLLSFEDRIEIVEAHAVHSVPHRTTARADVLLAVKLLAAQLPRSGPPVVALSEESGSLEPAIHAWLPFTSSPEAIAAAVIAAAAGLYTLTSDQAHLLSPRSELEQTRIEKLTVRELQVLDLMADGHGNKQIAAQLNISDHTAKFHVAQVLAKLGAGSRTEAVRVGIRRGLVAL
jgi:DNA-binding NarL/FixJ family response regulator